MLWWWLGGSEREVLMLVARRESRAGVDGGACAGWPRHRQSRKLPEEAFWAGTIPFWVARLAIGLFFEPSFVAEEPLTCVFGHPIRALGWNLEEESSAPPLGSATLNSLPCLALPCPFLERSNIRLEQNAFNESRLRPSLPRAWSCMDTSRIARPKSRIPRSKILCTSMTLRMPCLKVLSGANSKG